MDCFSTRITFWPLSASSSATRMPAPPAPTTTVSQVTSSLAWCCTSTVRLFHSSASRPASSRQRATASTIALLVLVAPGHRVHRQALVLHDPGRNLGNGLVRDAFGLRVFHHFHAGYRAVGRSQLPRLPARCCPGPAGCIRRQPRRCRTRVRRRRQAAGQTPAQRPERRLPFFVCFIGFPPVLCTMQVHRRAPAAGRRYAGARTARKKLARPIGFAGSGWPPRCAQIYVATEYLDAKVIPHKTIPVVHRQMPQQRGIVFYITCLLFRNMTAQRLLKDDFSVDQPLKFRVRKVREIGGQPGKIAWS